MYIAKGPLGLQLPKEWVTGLHTIWLVCQTPCRLSRAEQADTINWLVALGVVGGPVSLASPWAAVGLGFRVRGLGLGL